MVILWRPDHGRSSTLPVAFSTPCGLQHSLWSSALPEAFSTHSLWPWGNSEAFSYPCGLRHSLWPSALPMAWRHSWGTDWQSGSSKAVWRLLFQEPLLQAIPEPTHHPVYCISEACSVKPRLPPFKYPILLNHAWVALTLVNDCMCIVLISCCDIVVSSKSGQKEVNLLWTLHISQTFASTVTELQCP